MSKKTIRDHRCEHLPKGISIGLLYSVYEVCWYLRCQVSESHIYVGVDAVFEIPIRHCPYCGKELKHDDIVF